MNYWSLFIFFLISTRFKKRKIMGKSCFKLFLTNDQNKINKSNFDLMLMRGIKVILNKFEIQFCLLLKISRFFFN